MNDMRRDSAHSATAGVLAVALAAGILTSPAAWGDERHGERRREAREPYHTPHMVFDDRYRHGHYYPTVGYAVSVLPPGYLSIGYRSGRYYFHGGVWFQPGPRGYVVVRPPIGVVVPALPPAYATVWASGTPYYYANDAYYVQSPGGYAVATPPAVVEQGATSLAPPPTPAPAAAQAPSGPPASAPTQPAASVWYYCESSKTYYPYVNECKEGWRSVPAAPPPSR